VSFNSTLLRTCRSFHDYLRPGLYDYIDLSEGDANEQLADCLLAIFWTIDWRENLTVAQPVPGCPSSTPSDHGACYVLLIRYESVGWEDLGFVAVMASILPLFPHLTSLILPGADLCVGRILKLAPVFHPLYATSASSTSISTSPPKRSDAAI
jgi:hypothetical protein